MAIITLTTDWGLKDHYAGAVKGKILAFAPESKIVDITHQVPSFDIARASFILKNAFTSFPEGTIHVIGINSDASIDTPHIVMKYKGQYFVGADNGIFSLLAEDGPELVVEVDIMQDSDYFTFSARDVFVKVACHIALGKDVMELGTEHKGLTERIHFKPVVDKELIRGKVVYVDNYGNVFINVTQSLFKKTVGGKKFAIQFRKAAYEITKISRSYSDVPEGEMLALFSTSSYLEIALNRGRANSLLGLSTDDPVIITFSGSNRNLAEYNNITAQKKK